MNRGIVIKIENLLKDNRKNNLKLRRIYFIWLDNHVVLIGNNLFHVHMSRTNDIYLYFFTHFIYTFIITWILSEKLNVKLITYNLKDKGEKYPTESLYFVFFSLVIMLIHWILSIFKEELNRRYIYHLYYNFIFYKNFLFKFDFLDVNLKR